MAIVATSPADPNDTLSAEMRFSSEAVKGGEVELIVAVNGAAVSDQEPVEPLKVEVSLLMPRRAVDSGNIPSVSLNPSTGDGVLPLHPGPAEDELARFVLSWLPDPCREACIHSARLLVEEGGGHPPQMSWLVSAQIVYQRGEDSVPVNAGVVLGLRQHDTADLLSSNTPPGDLLPARGILLTSTQPRAHQTLQLEVPRSAIPPDHVAESGNADLVWRGGALRTLAATSETTGRVIVGSSDMDQVAVSVDGDVDLLDGTVGVDFEVPLLVACGPEVCTTDLEVDFELQEGPWLVLDWSNTVPGIRTEEGDIWVQGPWHLRLVDS